jgi:carboxylesterase type B
MVDMLKHPLLGEVEGIRHPSEDVTQYLGVQYATLAHRFAAPVVKTEYQGKVDATSFGYVDLLMCASLTPL